MDLLELSGPSFLGVYAILFVAAVVGGLFLRHVARGRGGSEFNGHDVTKLDPYEIAYLSGGPRLVINTVIAALYRSNALRLTDSSRALEAVGKPAEPAHPLERDVHRFVSAASSRSVREVHQSCAAEFAARRPQAMGLTLTGGERVQVGLISALPLIGLFSLGVAKFAVGVTRDRPVVFLGFFLFATLVATVIVLATTPRRTQAGEAALRGMKSMNAALRSTAVSQPNSLPVAEFALAVGLFGPAVLAAGSLGDLRQAIQPPGSSGGGSCGSGCSSGGGGDGGGGGGGCGGCGGGGGD
jgi:uncharacterized protein (TIGR04222 family)